MQHGDLHTTITAEAIKPDLRREGVMGEFFFLLFDWKTAVGIGRAYNNNNNYDIISPVRPVMIHYVRRLAWNCDIMSRFMCSRTHYDGRTLRSSFVYVHRRRIIISFVVGVCVCPCVFVFIYLCNCVSVCVCVYIFV